MGSCVQSPNPGLSCHAGFIKTCEQCGGVSLWQDRVQMGEEYRDKPLLYKLVCVLLIYLPLFALPFIWLGAMCSYWHLRSLGVKNLRTYSSYLPARESHRYDLKSQVTMQPGFKFNPISSKLFWIANCTWYCPYSVALFEWQRDLQKQMSAMASSRSGQ